MTAFTPTMCRAHLVRLLDTTTMAQAFCDVADHFPSAAIPVGAAGPVFEDGPALGLPEMWEGWRTREKLTSMLVLQHGKIRHESYHQGTSARDLRISWSIAKSYLSALLSILHHRGDLPPLDQLIGQILPRMTGAYAATTMAQLLDMTSGVHYDEAYLNPNSDIHVMARYLAGGGRMDHYTATRDARHAEPGKVWLYNSLDTHVLGQVLRHITGQSIEALLGQHLMGPLGCAGGGPDFDGCPWRGLHPWWVAADNS